MANKTDETRMMCKQYLIEADGDAALAYRLMQMECGLINRPMPVSTLEEFKQNLEV